MRQNLNMISENGETVYCKKCRLCLFIFRKDKFCRRNLLGALHF